MQNFRYVVLKPKKEEKLSGTSRSRFMRLFDLAVKIIVYMLMAGILVVWRATRKQNIASSGRHKKTDHDYL